MTTTDSKKLFFILDDKMKKSGPIQNEDFFFYKDHYILERQKSRNFYLFIVSPCIYSLDSQESDGDANP